MASLTLDWIHIVVLLGAIQGVFLTAALVAKRTNRTANRLLAAAMLAFSIYLATTVYHVAKLELAYPFFFGWAYPMPFIFGPLIYLYAVAASDRSHRLSLRDALHFVPFLAVVIAGLPLYMMGAADKAAFPERLAAGDVPVLLMIADPLKFVSGIGYTIATLVFLRRHRQKVKDSYSSTERVNLRWMLWLGGGAAAVWVLATTLNVLEGTRLVHIARAEDYISLAIAVMVYGIGYMGLRQPEVFRYETAEYAIPKAAAALKPTPAAQAEPAETEAARYERSGLSDAQAAHLKERLLAVMEKDRPWKNSDLTLADLADRLGTTPHKLSEVLNSQVGETFYDFVNGYRVREVQRRIAAGEARALKMLSLALDAGFASKSTFNQVFKKHTNQTPSDFRQAAGA